MAAFGHLGDGIDRTPPGSVYIVDSDGWGWFALFLIVILPFFVMGLILTQVINVIRDHIFLSLSIYIAVVLVIDIIIFRRERIKYKIAGFIAVIFAFAPFALVEGLYMIPYIIKSNLFASLFEWLFVTAFISGITFLVMAVSKLFKNGFIRLIISLAFTAITYFILNADLCSANDINWSLVCSTYK